MAKILDWNSSEDTRDVVHIVVQALVEGRQVVLPADKVYHLFASGLKCQDFSRFEEPDPSPLGSSSLVLRSAQELLDYCLESSPITTRIAQRAWPGPLILSLPTCGGRGLLSRLPSAVQSLVAKDGRVSLRSVAHPCVQQAQRLMPGPLIAAPIQQNGSPVWQPFKAGELAEASLVVDDRHEIQGEFPTVLKIDDNRCQVVQPGAMTEETLHRLSQLVILLVCTGNTCRSPMAEVLLRDKFDRRFSRASGTPSPVFVASGGISAYPGGPASVEAQNVMASRGLCLTDHQSRAVTKHSLQLADLILVMTRSHRQALLDNLPEIKSKVHLLSGNSADVSDPFGGPESLYSACADQIDHFLEQWVQRLPDSVFPVWQS